MRFIHYPLLLLLGIAGCESNTPTACITPPANAFTELFITINATTVSQSDEPWSRHERNKNKVELASYSIQKHEVTNAQFTLFVDATGYITDAEKQRENALENGSALFFHSEQNDEPHWQLRNDVNWRHPYGENSSINDKLDHPVVHVSLRDARAYAEWAGGRLPTELEWEYAATLGLADPSRIDSGAYDDQNKPIANTWQGIFPLLNTNEDGFKNTSPVACYLPSKIGLYDMIGNAWEWTNTPKSKSAHIIKGGSFLCANNFCKRYKPISREDHDIDFSSNHIGFRIVKSNP